MTTRTSRNGCLEVGEGVFAHSPTHSNGITLSLSHFTDGAWPPSLSGWGGPGTHESVASAAHAASSAASAAAMQRRPRPIGVGGGAAGPGGGGGRGATTSARSKAAEAFVGRNTRVGRRRRLAGRRLFLRRGVPLHLRGGGNKASHWQQLTSSLWRNWHLAQ